MKGTIVGCLTLACFVLFLTAWGEGERADEFEAAIAVLEARLDEQKESYVGIIVGLDSQLNVCREE